MPKKRTFYRDELCFSADPEIREFMDFRDTTLARRPIDQRRQETRQETARQQQKDYNELLRELIETPMGMYVGKKGLLKYMTEEQTARALEDDTFKPSDPSDSGDSERGNVQTISDMTGPQFPTALGSSAFRIGFEVTHRGVRFPIVDISR
jgi:hypothetical protein